MNIWIVSGTFLNCFIAFFFSRFFSVKFFKKVILFNFFFSIVLTILCYYEIGYMNEMSYLYLFNWLNIGLLKINIVFLFDTLTVVMVFIVLFISALVHMYSFSYMREDPYFVRFIGYLSLFTFFMLILVTSDNFLQLLIGWEGVGLFSYLLICFWYTRIAANLAAIKAMSVNRIGDIFLLFTIFLIYSLFGSFNFSIVFNNVIYITDMYFDLYFIEICVLDILCLLIFLSACGKSAQLLLHIWLPDAMEGPTPVSALIHAATMVTAGVFLIIRCSIIFEYSSNILFLMVFFGSLTCFLMSVFGIFQQDIKKIVAYSTCSQLGYMFMGCGLSSYNTSFFHLFNHAFFKALLFLSMGVIIHALADEQDLRKMGNLLNFLPYTALIVFFGNFALLGLPFLAGFYSKDILIEVAFVRFYFDGNFAYLLGLFAVFFTAFYSTRLFLRVFFSYSNFNRFTIFKIHEVDILMFIPLIVLLLCSFFVGYFFFDMFIGLGSFFFFDSIYINFLNYSGIFVEFESVLRSVSNNTFYLLNLKIVYNFLYNFFFKFFEYSIIFNLVDLNNTNSNNFFIKNNVYSNIFDWEILPNYMEHVMVCQSINSNIVIPQEIYMKDINEEPYNIYWHFNKYFILKSLQAIAPIDTQRKLETILYFYTILPIHAYDVDTKILSQNSEEINNLLSNLRNLLGSTNVNENYLQYFNVLELRENCHIIAEKNQYKTISEDTTKFFIDYFGITKDNSHLFYKMLEDIDIVDKEHHMKIRIDKVVPYSDTFLLEFYNLYNSKIVLLNIINKIRFENLIEKELLIDTDTFFIIKFLDNYVNINKYNYLNENFFNYFFVQEFFIKVLPLFFSILGFCFYFFFNDRFFLWYKNGFYRNLVFIFFNGLFFDKLLIDMLVSKFYFFSYYSFYKNIESSFFQKYNILFFEKQVSNIFYTFKWLVKGHFFIYLLIVLKFIFIFILFFIVSVILNFFTVEYIFLFILICINLCIFKSDLLLKKNIII